MRRASGPLESKPVIQTNIMPVTSEHPDFTAAKADWEQIADCIAGQRKVKAAGCKYLPKPNAEDKSPENTARYDAYLQRAVFHNVTGRTVDNNVGQCFAVEPVPTMPDEMLAWLDDVDGASVSAVQQSKKALGLIVGFSRAFLWVDYPKTNGVVSKGQAERENIRPRIILCDPRNVPNWRVETIGAKTLLSLVTIKEQYVKEDDGFEAVFATQYRVLKLVGGVYVQEVWREGDGDSWVIFDTLNPLDGSNKPFNEIPGTFIGAESNDAGVEKPLMLDISNLNIAHFRDSADYQEGVYMLGQPTPYFTGLDNAWVTDVLKGKIMLGSRAIIPLPQGATAGLIQVQPNTLAKESMDQKENLMNALGARLVEMREVQKTATEDGNDEASETSVLATCCDNVSAAYKKGFEWAAQYGAINIADPDSEDTGIWYELNKDFAVNRMTPEDGKATLELVNGGLLTWSEGRDRMRKGGLATKSDEDAKDEIETKEDEDFEKAKAELKNQTDEAARLAGAKKPPAPAAA